MALSRREMIAAGGLTAGLATSQTLLGSTSMAGAAVTASKDAFSVTDTAAGVTAADPTGALDSTAAIQQHIDFMAWVGGGNVYFPVGTYKVSQTIEVRPTVNLVGGGNSFLGSNSSASTGQAGTATLLGASAFTGTILHTAAGVDQGNIISNLRIAGPAATTSSVLFEGGSNGKGTRVERCAFWRRGTEVVKWSSVGVFTGNYIYGHNVTGCIGLRVTTPDTEILGNEITSRGTCVWVEGGAGGVLFEHNAVYNSNEGPGIRWFGLRGAIVGNRFDENAGEGILVEGWGNVVSGNALVLNGVDSTRPPERRVGIRLHWGWGNAVTGNTSCNWTHGSLVDTQQYGISLTGDSNPNIKHNVVTGNALTRNKLGGIYVNPGVGPGNIIDHNAVMPY